MSFYSFVLPPLSSISGGGSYTILDAWGSVVGGGTWTAKMMGSMSMNDEQHPQTHLFMVRIWVEDLGESKTEYRGKVQHVLSKEVRYFRDWTMLITVLHEMIILLESVKRK